MKFTRVWLLLAVCFPSLLLHASPAKDWLAAQQSANGLVDSYEGDGSTVAYTYDQAVAAIAFTAEGDLTRARSLLTRMVAIQNLEGSWDDAYYSNNAAPTSTWRATGNSIWMVMAINYYTLATGDRTYVASAKKCADWFLTLQDTNPADLRYGSISGGLTDTGALQQWTSTEHNLDAYSALKVLSQILNDPFYNDRANLVYQWLTTKMWEPSSGHFYVGLTDMAGNINFGQYMDVQAWGVSALGVSGPNGADYTRGLTWAEAHMRLTRSYNGQNIDGFDYDGSTAPPSGGVWFEGTEQMAVAYQVAGNAASSDYFHGQAGKGQDANGGVITACGDGSTAWPTNYPFHGVAPTGWYIFGSQTPRVNPFQPAADTRPPTLSNIVVSNITANSAIVTWTTDEPSDSQVDYGTALPYSNTTPLAPALTTSHSVALSGLNPSSTYHFRVRSKDASANMAESVDGTFATVAADTTPPVISGVTSSGITASAATVTWTTDENSDSLVEYGLTTSYGATASNGALSTSHSIGLSGLTAGTTYHYHVKSRDASGNTATSADFTFATSAADTTPPVISGVASSGISTSAATISWTTDEASDSQVEYGTTTSYGSSTALNSAMVTSHSAALSGLASATTYHYRVKSKDASGNLATSGDFTFATSAPADTTPPTISGVGSSGITDQTAAIAWTTDENSDSQVEYGTSTAYGNSTALNSAMVTAHSMALSGLTGSTLYHYRVKSKDAAGNLGVSGDFTFTTSAPATQTKTYVPSSVSVSQGFGDGNVGGLAADENNYMAVNAAQVGSSFNTDWTASSTIAEARSAVSKLTINYAGHYTANQVQNLYVYNFDASAWDLVDSETVATVDQVFSVPVANPVSHVSSSGEIRARVVSQRVDNVASYTDLLTFTVELNGTPGDTTPPSISAVQSSGVTKSAATIAWNTNEPSDSQVEYGTTTAYGLTSALNGSLVTGHSAALSGLSASTTYHYRVKSRDAAGNLATSGDFTFITSASTHDYFGGTVTMTQGSGLTGTGNLSADDDRWMTLSATKVSGIFGTDWYSKVQISESRSQVSGFYAVYSGHYSKSENQGIFLYNFVSGVWARIDYQAVGTTDKTIVYHTTDLASYLSPTGEIRMRVYASDSGNFSCSGDIVKFTVELK